VELPNIFEPHKDQNLKGVVIHSKPWITKFSDFTIDFIVNFFYNLC